VEAIQRKGVRVSVVSTIQTQPPMIADDLRRQADQFVELGELQSKIGRDPAQRPAREPRMPGMAEGRSGMPSFIERPSRPSRDRDDE
jgi:hypothetical protein